MHQKHSTTDTTDISSKAVTISTPSAVDDVSLTTS